MNRLLRRMTHALEFASHVDDRLRGNAPTDEARAAQLVSLDNRRIQPQLTGTDRRHITARTTADDEHFCSDHFRHSQSLPNPLLSRSLAELNRESD